MAVIGTTLVVLPVGVMLGGEFREVGTLSFELDLTVTGSVGQGQLTVLSVPD